MQELMDFTPQPPEKLQGLSFYQQLRRKLQSVLTMRSGNAKPSDVVDGELWCRQNADGSLEYYVWRSADGAGDGTLLQDFFKTDTVSENEETAKEHKFPTDKAVAAAFAEIKKSIIFYRSGDFKISFKNALDGFLLCDGSAVSRETYAALFAVIGTTFGDGDGSTTFNLPDFRGRFIQGADGDLGSVKSAGLPNISGDVILGAISYVAYGVAVLKGNGALKGVIDSSSSGAGGAGVAGSYGSKLAIDASLSNVVYGRSETVQPPAVALNVFIKY